MRKLLLCLLLGTAFAQQATNIRSVSVLPAICKGGNPLQMSDAVVLISGGIGTLYICQAPNVWVPVGVAGGGGNLSTSGSIIVGPQALFAQFVDPTHVGATSSSGNGVVILQNAANGTGNWTMQNVSFSGFASLADGAAGSNSFRYTNNPQLGEYIDVTGGQHQIRQVVVSGSAGNQTIILTVSSPINNFSVQGGDTFKLASLPSSPTDLTSLNNVRWTATSSTTTKPTATLTFTATTSIAAGTYAVTQGSLATLGRVMAGHEIMGGRFRSTTNNSSTVGTLEAAVRDAWFARANFADDRAIDTPLLRGSQVSPQNATGVGWMTVGSPQTTGTTTLPITRTGSTWNAVAGDLIGIGSAFGDAVIQVYAVVGNTTVTGNATTNVTISPALLSNLNGGELIAAYGVVSQVGDGWGAEVLGQLTTGYAGQPWAVNVVKQPSTSVTVKAGYDATIFVRSDNTLGCQLSPALGGGSCAPSGGGGGGNTTSTAGTANSLPKFNGPNSIINSNVTDDATKIGTTNLPMDVGSGAYVWEIANNGSTATVLGKLAKIISSPSTATNALTTDTTGIIGVCIAGCGTTGNALIAFQGTASCVFDGTTTSNDYVTISPTTAGDCHDAGSTFPTSGQVIGRVLSATSVGGGFKINIFSPNNAGAAGTITGTGNTNQVSYWSSASVLTSNVAFSFDGTGILVGVPGGAGHVDFVGSGSGRSRLIAQSTAAGDYLLANDATGGEIPWLTGTPTTNHLTKWGANWKLIDDTCLTDDGTTLTYCGTGGLNVAFISTTSSGPDDWVIQSAPSTPAASHVSEWADSTDLRLHDRNSAGVIGTTSVSSTAAPHFFFCSMSVAGVFGTCQPNFADLAAGTVAAKAIFPGGDLFNGGIDAQSGTSYTVALADENKLLTFNNASAVAVTLPQATTAGFTVGAFFTVFNRGAGAVTITPTTSTINGAATAVLNQNQGAFITSDGTNYSAWISAAPTGGGTLTNVATTSPITGGPITTTGTIACATCTTNAAAATAHADLVGAGSQAIAVNANGQGTAKQVKVSGGSGADSSYIDFPDFHYFPSADCVNAIAGSGWSHTGTTPTETCRAGTNNHEAFLTWGASDTAEISIGLPLDWDSGTNPYVSLQLASTDATNGHTVIMQVATACGKGDGTTTDDVAFNAAQSFSTVTLNGNANRQWKTTLGTITMTGCTAGGILRMKVSRTTDTATNVRIYGLGITIPRFITVQAN